MFRIPRDIKHPADYSARRTAKAKIWQRALMAAALMSGVSQGQQYAGPKNIGPFRIDRDVSMNSLFKELGRPVSGSTKDVVCYRSSAGNSFLALTRMVETYDPEVAGDIVLSRSQTCVHHPVQQTTANFEHWKTEEGIGLGSRESQVEKAYGRPSSVRNVTDATCGMFVYGQEQRADKSLASEIQSSCKVLVYEGPHNSLEVAQVGIEGDKVVWIMLSHNE